MIFIPFQNFNELGGPTTFMQNLKSYFDKENFHYSTNYNNGDSIFFPVRYDLDLLKKIKSKKGKIIQRLDGIWYPEKHGNDYFSKNDIVKKIYLEYVDYIIFQSKYSREQCFYMFGEKTEDQYSIILNGADFSIFYPNTKLLDLHEDNIRFITTGNFRNIDMLEPVIFALDKLTRKYKFVLDIVGPIVNEGLQQLLNREYIQYRGPKGKHEVAEILRNSHIFLYSHVNPPCPNSVVEAIACGLPVVGFDSGSMKELCWFATDLLAPVSDNTFQKYTDFNYLKLRDKIEKCIVDYKIYRRQTMEHRTSYDFAICGAKYLEVLNKFSKKQSFLNRIIPRFL